MPQPGLGRDGWFLGCHTGPATQSQPDTALVQSMACLVLTACGHPAAQVRVLLVAGLALVPDDERGGQEPADVAAEVETAIFQKFGNTGAEYGAKVGCSQVAGKQQHVQH